MTNQFPVKIQSRKEPLPYIGWPWEKANQTSAHDNTILGRCFYENSFTERYITQVNTPPPLYTGTDSPNHYLVQRKMIQSEYTGQKNWGNISDPKNDFFGWQKIDTTFWLDVYYLDLVGLTITWAPITQTFSAGPPIVLEPTGNYLIKVVDNKGNTISSAITPSTATKAIISLPDYSWAGICTANIGTVSVTNIATITDTTGITVSTTKILTPNPWLLLTKPSSVFSDNGAAKNTESNTSSITVDMYGRLFDADITFANEISEPTILYHPPETVFADRLKPPGFSSLNDTYDTRTLGQPLSSARNILSVVSFS